MIPTLRTLLAAAPAANLRDLLDRERRAVAAPTTTTCMNPDCSMGETDINGNLYAGCEIKDLEFVEDGEPYTTSASIDVRAVDPGQIEIQGYENAETDDSTKIIFGDGFYVIVSASPALFANGAVDIDAIATAVGGTVQQP